MKTLAHVGLVTGEMILEQLRWEEASPQLLLRSLRVGLVLKIVKGRHGNVTRDTGVLLKRLSEYCVLGTRPTDL